MQILSTGGTMSAIEEQPEATSTLERYSPKELAGFLNAFWDDQAHRPIPTDIRWEDYAPEKVMLRFKDELKRLQPYVEGWFSERGERACLTGRKSISCRSKAGLTISRRTRMLQGFHRDQCAMNG